MKAVVVIERAPGGGRNWYLRGSSGLRDMRRWLKACTEDDAIEEFRCLVVAMGATEEEARETAGLARRELQRVTRVELTVTVAGPAPVARPVLRLVAALLVLLSPAVAQAETWADPFAPATEASIYRLGGIELPVAQPEPSALVYGTADFPAPGAPECGSADFDCVAARDSRALYLASVTQNPEACDGAASPDSCRSALSMILGETSLTEVEPCAWVVRLSADGTALVYLPARDTVVPMQAREGWRERTTVGVCAGNVFAGGGGP